MAVFQLRSILTPEERQQKQRLMLRDSFALLSLFAIAIVLSFVTYLLFHSFSVHREELGQRWRARGEAALHSGQPKLAIEALRSALAYAPDDEGLQVELAEALAESGRTTEAAAYFNTLLETQPGNGVVNLQLARLAVKQGNENLALDHYQAALDGTWEGDGYVRRREVRLELSRYLIDRRRMDQARSQLLIASGNAPDDPAVEVEIAGLMEAAQDPASALRLYKRAMQHRPVLLAALLGAGRSADTLGRYLEAKRLLERALSHPDFDRQPQEAQSHYRSMLADADHILLLYPGDDLSVKVRAERVFTNRKIAQKRLSDCMEANANAVPLKALAAKWQQIPDKMQSMQLERDPELEQNVMQLVFETETVTNETCGAPGGDDALLLKIAQTPQTVEQP